MIGKFLYHTPDIHPSVFIAPGAQIVGAVTVEEHASIWYNSVLRADINTISIGKGTNIQDGTIIHLSDEQGVMVGNYVTVGHGAILHACRIEDYALIGMGAVILNGAHIGTDACVAAGSLVLTNASIPPRTLVMGRPANVIRGLSQEEIDQNRQWAKKYMKLGEEYRKKNT
ncbi:gamma carbonic anhydrase family protein [bacterium]|nr:gamma carbonic anhydrase family protein [bacterium]MCP5461980.1 gamma carbonic anhydrase family protein [bacterium]